MQRPEIAWHAFTPEDEERLRAALGRVLPRHPWVKAAYLYGSAARRDRPARDVDVGLVADPPPESWAADLRLASELRLELSPPLELDVRIISGADPVFLNRVLSEGRLLYEADRERRLRFEVEAMSRWLDFAPVWKRLRAEVLRRWSGG